jgi:integrase
MPSYVARVREIDKWIEIFGETPRETIEKNAINDALYRLRRDGYQPSTVNKFRTALMSLWTTLDGRSVPNPVRDTVLFEEPPMTPRGHSYELLTRILDAIPDERGIAIDRRTLYGELWKEPATVVATRYGISATFLARVCTRLRIPRPPRGYWMKPADERPAAPPLFRGINSQAPELLKSRARLEVLAWTGMDPLQLARMTPDDFSVEEGWYTPPLRRKGRRRRGSAPMPSVRLPMTPDARDAFGRLVAVDGLGPFNGKSLLNTWLRACRKVEREIRQTDRKFRMPHIRLKDLRHSFGTQVYADTGGDLNTVARMLGHAPGSPMTIRYSLGAVPEVLRTQMQKFTTPTRRKSALGNRAKAKKIANVLPLTRKS